MSNNVPIMTFLYKGGVKREGGEEVRGGRERGREGEGEREGGGGREGKGGREGGENLIFVLKVLFNKFQTIVKSITSRYNNVHILGFFLHPLHNGGQDHIALKCVGLNILADVPKSFERVNFQGRFILARHILQQTIDQLVPLTLREFDLSDSGNDRSDGLCSRSVCFCVRKGKGREEKKREEKKARERRTTIKGSVKIKTRCNKRNRNRNNNNNNKKKIYIHFSGTQGANKTVLHLCPHGRFDRQPSLLLSRPLILRLRRKGIPHDSPSDSSGNNILFFHRDFICESKESKGEVGFEHGVDLGFGLLANFGVWFGSSAKEDIRNVWDFCSTHSYFLSKKKKKKKINKKGVRFSRKQTQEETSNKQEKRHKTESFFRHVFLGR